MAIRFSSSEGAGYLNAWGAPRQLHLPRTPHMPRRRLMRNISVAALQNITDELDPPGVDVTVVR
jgi:hypothetical protein